MFPFKSNAAASAASSLAQPMSAMPSSWGMPFTGGSVPFSAPSTFGAVQPFANAAQGMMPLQQLSGLAGAGQATGGGSQIMGMIGKIQNVIQTANRVVPMVQQYGPMVRNVPSIFKMMREFRKFEKESPSDSEENNKQKESSSQPESQSKNKNVSIKEPENKKAKPDENIKKEKITDGELKPSKPKMYV